MNLQPEALAVALAIMVFPHPGGPNNKTPARRHLNRNEELRFFKFLHTVHYSKVKTTCRSINDALLE